MTLLGAAPLTTPPSWRDDIDSVAFQPDGHSGVCVVHRRAFRTLLGRAPSEQECLAFFALHAAAFAAAAAAKIARRNLAPEANFHLTSRDHLRALGSCALGEGPRRGP